MSFRIDTDIEPYTRVAALEIAGAADEATHERAVASLLAVDGALTSADAAHLVTAAGHAHDKHVQVLRRYLGALAGKRILDIGCGCAGLVFSPYLAQGGSAWRGYLSDELSRD